MNILYLTKGDHVDYQNDCLLIGLKELFGSSVVDCAKQSHNYVSFDPNEIKRFWGQGMTVTRILPDLEVDRTDITQKIKTNFFDYIVYGSIWRYDGYLNEILQHYPSNKVIAVDGEDHTNIHPCINLNVQYFKRELVYDHTQLTPISFAIPTCKVLTEPVRKTKHMAYINPLDRSTYIYDNEKDYYNDYKEARFGVTLKKAGWDCMRHYEIMANRCLPYFIDLDRCPPRTMTLFPKKEIIELKHRLDANENTDALYDFYQETIYDNLLQNHTTKALAEYFIAAVKSNERR